MPKSLLPIVLLVLTGCPDQTSQNKELELKKIQLEVVQLRGDLAEAMVRIEELEKVSGLAPGDSGEEIDAQPRRMGGKVVALAKRPPSIKRAWKWTRLSRSQVRDTVYDKAQAIHDCLEPMLGGELEQGTSLDLVFKIQRNGRVSDLRVPPLESDVGSCLEQVVGQLRFPKFSGKAMQVRRLPFSLAWQAEDPESPLLIEDKILLSQNR